MKVADAINEKLKGKDMKTLISIVKELEKDSKFSVKKDFRAFSDEAIKRAEKAGLKDIISYDVLDALDAADK